jgi:hypothetical protein
MNRRSQLPTALGTPSEDSLTGSFEICLKVSLCRSNEQVNLLHLRRDLEKKNRGFNALARWYGVT